MQFVIIGNPENRRVIAFCEATQRMGHDAPIVIPYLDLLSGKGSPQLPEGSILKIDSPGENDTVRKMLIARGLQDDKSIYAPHSLADNTNSSKDEFGKIRHMRSWYAGFCHWLDEVGKWIDDQDLVVMNRPEDIKLQFDKPRCQAHLQGHGVPVPAVLPVVSSYDDLISKMKQHRLLKVFIKPAHASSASGVIAFRRMGDKVQAITPAEIVNGPDGIELYNSLTVRTYTKESDIAALINRILPENTIVEEWLPKATLHDRFFDIRVLVIAGRARHTVIRTSRHPITNLHLGNKRGDMAEFISRIGGDKLRHVKMLAESAAATLPSSLYTGVDILLTADLHKMVVLEMNAFGDLLPGLVDEGETCYEAQVRAMVKQQEQLLC